MPISSTDSATHSNPAVDKLVAPSRALLLREGPRTAADLVRMTAMLMRRNRLRAGADGRRIMVVPGFGANDRYTYWLRRYLNQLGFQAEGWGLGTNQAGRGLTGEVDFYEAEPKYQNRPELEVPLLCMRLRERVRQRAAETGDRYVLLGHSLGGYLAREAARQAPEAVQQLITFGSPIYGGPKYTAGGPIFARRGVDVDWIERVVAEREQLPIDMPISTIVSPTDGVVGYQAAIDRNQPQARLLEIDAGHSGMAFNPDVWQLITQELLHEQRPSS